MQTLVVTDPGYSLLKQHFEGGNDQQLSGGNVAGNTGNDNMDTIDILKQQLTVKDQQLKAKDEQLKLMQQLLDQSQQLQLMAEQKLVHHEALGATESPDKSPDEPLHRLSLNTNGGHLVSLPFCYGIKSLFVPSLILIHKNFKKMPPKEEF